MTLSFVSVFGVGDLSGTAITSLPENLLNPGVDRTDTEPTRTLIRPGGRGSVSDDGRAKKQSQTGPILIVDDDPISRQLLGITLGRAGMATVGATSGRRALELIACGNFAAVVLDNHMPEMSGVEVVERLRTRVETRTLPVILVTADSTHDERLRGLQAGADDYIVKPFEPDELVARVKAKLREQAAWTEVIESHLRKRAAIASALGRVTPGGTPEATADLVCSELASLNHLSGAAVVAFLGDGVAVPLAARDLAVWNMEVGRPLATSVAAHLTNQARCGPWIEHLDEDGALGLPGAPLPELSTLACAPLHTAGEVLGLLVSGADPPGRRASAGEMSRALSEAIDFAGIAAGLLGSALHNRRDGQDRRTAVEHVVRDEEFTPVFQPIVRLADGLELGYEALTRFADGTRPDLRFAEAAGVDLGIELEVATMRAALDAADALPPGRFLSLNASPALAMAGSSLGDLVGAYDRPLILELTEHDPVDDYEPLRHALDLLSDLRISVDDAGSGFASLRHVLAVKPHFMKLDRSWVSGIDSDPARQSLVAGLAHFADNTGCRLIAEGIESRSEVDTLRQLGIGLGQGYLFGYPEPAGVHAFADRRHVRGSAADEPAAHEPETNDPETNDPDIDEPVTENRVAGEGDGDAADGARRVLVVDDDPMVRHLMRLSLELGGAQVIEAISLADARRALGQHLDGVVLDRQLPDGDGLDLLPELQEQHPGIKTVVCSSVDDQREPFSVMRVPKEDISGIVRALGLPTRPLLFGSSNSSVPLGTEAGPLAEEWLSLCRQNPMVTGHLRPAMAEQVVARLNAVARTRPTAWEPEPELASAIEAFAATVGSVESAIGHLVCLRETLRRRIVDRVPPEQLIETLASLDMVVDWAIGVAATHNTAHLRNEAVTDPLTGLLNRRAFDRDLKDETARSSRLRYPFSVIVLDLDGLKAVNDEHGHAAGDEALRSLAHGLCSALRLTDSAYRVGGDEFTVLLPGTGKAVIPTVIARVKEAGAPAFSWGSATYFDDSEDGERLVELADQRLFDQRRTDRGGLTAVPDRRRAS